MIAPDGSVYMGVIDISCILISYDPPDVAGSLDPCGASIPGRHTRVYDIGIRCDSGDSAGINHMRSAGGINHHLFTGGIFNDRSADLSCNPSGNSGRTDISIFHGYIADLGILCVSGQYSGPVISLDLTAVRNDHQIMDHGIRNCSKKSHIVIAGKGSKL